MLKARALRAVNESSQASMTKIRSVTETGINGLVKSKQNFLIESVGNDESIPDAVGRLAVKLLDNNDLIKDYLRELRQNYCQKQERFHLSLVGKTSAEKQTILELFQDLYGAVSSLHYCPECQVLNGSLVFSAKAQRFLTGEYLEIGVYETIRKIMDEISSQHKVTYRLYKNVRVATREGRLKNEFDIVIECQGFFYVIEVKSGKQFDDWGNFAEIGEEYGIVPDRLLLVDSHITDAHAQTIEYFCEYYVCNLKHESLREKIVEMIRNDLEEETYDEQ